MRTESSIERAFKRWCEQQGWLCLKLTGPKGWPDRCIITDKEVLFLELKRPGGTLGKLQNWWVKRLNKFGGCRAGVAWTLQEAKEFCNYENTKNTQ